MRNLYDRAYLCGDSVEMYHYDRPVLIGYSDGGRGKSPAGPRRPAPRDDSSVNRTRQKLRRLAKSNKNHFNAFLTLTFAENMTDVSAGNAELKKFFKRLNYRWGTNVSYLGTFEFQARGAVHYHFLVRVPENILLMCSTDKRPARINDILTEVWGHGFVWLRKLKSPARSSAYIAKYVTKSEFDVRYFGKRVFLYSFDITRPIRIDNFAILANLIIMYNVEYREAYRKTFDSVRGSITLSYFDLCCTQ